MRGDIVVNVIDRIEERHEIIFDTKSVSFQIRYAINFFFEKSFKKIYHTNFIYIIIL